MSADQESAKPSAITVLKRASFLGLKLGSADNGGMLSVQPWDDCPHEFRGVLREHKAALLALLKLPFVLVHSEPLGTWLFLCEDDGTRQALIAAGAQPDSDVIYTRAELQILLEHNRARPFVPDELLRLHAIKKLFGATITREENEP